MGAGGSLEIVYPLQGAAPAGSYLVDVAGPQAANDAHLRIDLALQSKGSADQILSSTDARAGDGVDGGQPGAAHFALVVPVSSGRCGDRLILRANLLSASSPYLEFFLTLTLP